MTHPPMGYDYLFGNRSGLKNGQNMWLEFGVKINIGTEAELTIGDFVYVNCYTIIDCYLNIKIGNRVQIGPHCYIGDFDHNIRVDISRKLHHREEKKKSPIVIEDNVWIGAGVIILKGVTIGKNSVIAAGSVVAANIPQNVVVAGVPAKIIKTIVGNVEK
jgi:acetyltransferase-like isoleucine patch superfamily enzyme